MTLRENTLAALRGEAVEHVPFTCYKGLLPAGAEAIDNLCMVVTPRAATLTTPGVSTTSEEIAPGRRLMRMETPWGVLTREVEVESGYGSGWTREHWIKRPEDYAVLEQVLRTTEIARCPESYTEARETVGDRGIALLWTARAPFQRLWIEYAGIERLSYDLADCPAEVEGVLDAMLEQSRQIARIAAASEAELIWLPDNITGEIAGTTIFARYMARYYREICEILLPAGKLPCCHMDGFLRQISESIGATEVPVIEAFTPPPDGNLSVADAFAAWPEKRLSLNFPSSVHLSAPEEIRRMTRALVAEAGGRPGFVMGVTENIPASVGARSLEAIGSALEED